MASSRAEGIPPFYVMEILERAHELEARGREIIHLEIGEPDFETPRVIKEAACEALEKGMTQYTHSQGIPELREAIALYYRTHYGVEIEPENIIVTSGASSAMILLFVALLNPGERLVLGNPSYACYSNTLELLGGIPTYIEIKEEEKFKMDPARLKKLLTPDTKGILINSPANPTGVVLSSGEIEEIVEETGDRAYIISDEIYHGLNYGEKDHTILEYTDRAFVLNSFSKRYAMTGWRLGYVISPPWFSRPMQKIHQSISICANSFVQWAGIAALSNAQEEVEMMRKAYDTRRKYLLRRLNEIGFGVPYEPQGAFYIFANAKDFTSNSYEFSLELLDKASVAVTPGTDFGSGGEGYIRFSYANSLENIAEGTQRLEKYLHSKG
ncbi:MAG: pyridoxal phosphate-dependent aminotransferase [Actinomycetota bacterium]|nr:pyridoxal phosphate-dependent aminotransferase [Actinomycetota bacterium]